MRYIRQSTRNAAARKRDLSLTRRVVAAQLMASRGSGPGMDGSGRLAHTARLLSRRRPLLYTGHLVASILRSFGKSTLTIKPRTRSLVRPPKTTLRRPVAEEWANSASGSKRDLPFKEMEMSEWLTKLGVGLAQRALPILAGLVLAALAAVGWLESERAELARCVLVDPAPRLCASK